MLAEPREAPSRTSTFELAAGHPSRIDLTTVSEGGSPPLHTQGIYALEGDRLTYCVAPPGKARPTTLAPTTGEGHTLVLLKRAAPERP
jgi:uncharacterized protein (TIGR03067 family)